MKEGNSSKLMNEARKEGKRGGGKNERKKLRKKRRNEFKMGKK